MKTLQSLLTILPSLLSIASAQLLTQGIGTLPPCGQTCPNLVNAQSTCNGASSTSLTAWKCFCQTVWTASNGALSTVCATTCPSPNDATAVAAWYSGNCGSDNGASEHGGTPGGSGTVGGTSSSSVPSSQPSGSAASGSVGGTAGTGCSGWWACHWKWVVMIIVIAIGLLILGFGGRWLKKRHDRKQDRMSESFNAGITTRGPPMSAHDVNASHIAAPADVAGRDSPSRTREAFMPYGYGYTRSESRLGNNSSPLARGTTPVNEMEKGTATPDSAPKKKSRRIMVREKFSGRES